MTKQELIDEVNAEINVSFALPTQLQQAEIERIIKQTTLWFHENYAESVQTQRYILQASEFQKEEFKKTRTITMPECVVSVSEVKEITGAGILGSVDRDFADNKLIASEIYLSPFTGDSMVFRTAQYQFFDLAKAFFLEVIGYDFNRRTRKITILGRDPRKDVCITSYVKIPDEDLYDDYYFFRYVTAKAKISLARQLTFFDFNLMGGIKINASDIKAEGEAEVEKIETTINDQQPPDFFLTYH